MVTCRDAWKKIRNALQSGGIEDAQADAGLLMELAAGTGWRWRDEPLSEKEESLLSDWTKQRLEHRPIQYIAGRWPFLNLELEVGPGVLVPRADTEVVCEAAADRIRGVKEAKILDLCAGSGALGLGLASLLDGAQVTCLEKSPEAFVYLARNCAQNPAVLPVTGDIFCYQDELKPESLDLIVSNPPYLTQDEMQELQPEVAFEPAMALDGGCDGLDFYRHIAAAYRSTLRPGGWLVFEIGWQQRSAVENLLRENQWTAIGGCKDLGGNDRAVWAQRPIGK